MRTILNRSWGRKTSKSTECETCAKIRSILQGQEDEILEPRKDWNKNIPLGTMSKIASSECPHHRPLLDRLIESFDAEQSELMSACLALHISTGLISSGNMDYKFVLIEPKRKHVFRRSKETVAWSAGSFGPIELEKKGKETSVPRHGVRLDEHWIDHENMVGWYEECKSQHGETCSKPPVFDLISSPTIRIFIDTKDMCLVEASSNESFVALSYVWGRKATLETNTSNFQELLRPGVLDSRIRSGSVPHTVAHAVHLTQLLKERYLWVDRLCIVGHSS